MADYQVYDTYDAPSTANPYGIEGSTNLMQDGQRHASGNAMAANVEARVTAEVKAQVSIAKMFPRDPRLAADSIMKECERPTLADKATYSYPRGQEQVSGPSINLARVMARSWGNFLSGFEVMERTQGTDRKPGRSTVMSFAWDLETNAYRRVIFEVKHWRDTRKGGYALKDDRDIYELEANMAARRERACILALIPGDVTQMAIDKCRMTIASGVSGIMNDPNKRRRYIAHAFKGFEDIGVTGAEIEGYLGARSEDWTADHILRLKDLKNGLDDGELNLGEIFPRLAQLGNNAVITADQSAALMEMAKQYNKQRDFSNWLKTQGIAKVADVPADRFGDCAAWFEQFEAKEKIVADPAPDQTPLPWDDTKDAQ